MNIPATAVTVAITLIFNFAIAQEWTKKDVGRAEYVLERTECAQQSQKMALVGDELQRDISECLAIKGWQRNQANEVLDLYCEEKAAVKACRRGGTGDIYKKDRAECLDQVQKTVGTQYSRPGWSGIGGLVISTMQTEENRKALIAAQINAMTVCLEGRSWAVELKGSMAKSVEQAK